MASIDVVNWENSKVSQVKLAPEVFEKPVNKDLMHTVVNWQRAKKKARHS